jgi:hypothetical protein
MSGPSVPDLIHDMSKKSESLPDTMCDRSKNLNLYPIHLFSSYFELERVRFGSDLILTPYA